MLRHGAGGGYSGGTARRKREVGAHVIPANAERRRRLTLIRVCSTATTIQQLSERRGRPLNTGWIMCRANRIPRPPMLNAGQSRFYVLVALLIGGALTSACGDDGSSTVTEPDVEISDAADVVGDADAASVDVQPDETDGTGLDGTDEVSETDAGTDTETPELEAPVAQIDDRDDVSAQAHASQHDHLLLQRLAEGSGTEGHKRCQCHRIRGPGVV